MDCSQITSITLTDIVKVLFISLLCLGTAFTLRGVLALLLQPLLIEVVVWGGAIAGLASGLYADQNGQQWLVPIGAFLFAGANMATAMLRKLKPNFEGFCSMLVLVWGATALFYQDSIVGFMSIGALLALLGFSVYFSPLMYGFGFKDEKQIPQATFAGFLMTAAYVVAKMTVKDFGMFQVFEAGALWLGSFVWFLGLLILSSRWVSKGASYLLYQVITIVSFAFAITMGAIWGVSQVTTIAGAFLILYVAEKIMEVPTEEYVGMGLKLLTTGGMFWFVWHVLTTNPEIATKFLNV